MDIRIGTLGGSALLLYSLPRAETLSKDMVNRNRINSCELKLSSPEAIEARGPIRRDQEQERGLGFCIPVLSPAGTTRDKTIRAHKKKSSHCVVSISVLRAYPPCGKRQPFDTVVLVGRES